MSEELRDASKTLPRVIVSTTILNSVIGFAMLVYVFVTSTHHDRRTTNEA